MWRLLTNLLVTFFMSQWLFKEAGIKKKIIWRENYLFFKGLISGCSSFFVEAMKELLFWWNTPGQPLVEAPCPLWQLCSMLRDVGNWKSFMESHKNPTPKQPPKLDFFLFLYTCLPTPLSFLILFPMPVISFLSSHYLLNFCSFFRGQLQCHLFRKLCLVGNHFPSDLSLFCTALMHFACNVMCIYSWVI